MAARVTIKTIAKDLGISHMTVSRALSDHPNVQKETRELVRKRASELGYVKNAAATAMRGDGTKIIGLLLPNIVNEFYARFANELASICETFAFQLIIHLTNDDYRTEQKALQQLREVQAKAVVMVPAPVEDDSDTPSPVHLEGINVIQLIRQRRMNGDEAAILVDDAAAISRAVEHLHGLGHQKIAFIGAHASLSSGQNRLKAYMNGLQKCGLDADSSLIVTAPPSFKMGGSSAMALLERSTLTAIVCGGFEISNGALNVLLDSGKALGQDIAFIGYGDPSFYTWIEGGISTISVPVTPLAEQALDVLRIDHEKQKHVERTFRFDAELIIRQT